MSSVSSDGATEKQGSNVNTPARGERTRAFKRDPAHRVFVNRSLHMSKIGFFGFDLDYTLAIYKSPEYEAVAFNFIKERLVAIGYPAEILEFEYDPNFATRGLWFDKQYGNLLKVDSYGNILVCVHGFKFLKSCEVRQIYPNKFIIFDDKRIHVLNTLFHLPELYMLACIIDYFTNSPMYDSCSQHSDSVSSVDSAEQTKTVPRTDRGVMCGEIFMPFESIFQDVRNAVDKVHDSGILKQLTCENLRKYVHKDERLPVLLNRMREHGSKVFLLTNSDYPYTDKIMSYLLHGFSEGRNWQSYFDYVVVEARKPGFFEGGTTLREVNTETGALKLGVHMGPMKSGRVYAGGSVDILSQMLGISGKDVLYVGDHIYGDILKSKKIRGWRTFLVVPELGQELNVWHEKRDLFATLGNLDSKVSEIFRQYDSTAVMKPDITEIQDSIREVVHEMDMSYGMLGSLFRSGSRQTQFAGQMIRYADLYSSTFLNLLHYPFFYLFKAPTMQMPHESTVDPELPIDQSVNLSGRGRSTSMKSVSFDGSRENGLEEVSKDIPFEDVSMGKGHVPHLRADTPRRITHHHDVDDSDDESSSPETSQHNGHDSENGAE